MDWRELLKGELEHTCRVTEALMDLVDPAALGWRPSTGQNWMTTGQLLHHTATACGPTFRGFVTGDWGMPTDPAEMSADEMLPPAEKLPAAGSVAEARKLLAEDRLLALEILASVSDADLATRPVAAPWDPRPLVLGYRLLQMIEHLKQHRGQLFYYLKLQGQPVHTGHLWGM